MIASFRNRARFSMFLVLTVVAVTAVGLTDAQGGERRVIKRITTGPVAVETIERLDQSISFELTNATFAELLNTVSNKTGLTVKVAPELATSPVQQARFTIKAENVPALALLTEALSPFELHAEPADNGVAIEEGVADIIHMAGHEMPVVEEEVVTDSQKTVIRKGDHSPKFDGDGKVHSEWTFNLSRDGVAIAGKLTLDITK